jgi:ATP-dependent RNA helicase DeaD
VPPARKRRAETLLNLAGIDAVWGIAPQPDEIRKLDQERMLKDDLFAAETTAEDLAIAQALLAERSAEDIAAALARLYRARLPSPEDIADPGEGRVKSRAERAQERAGRESGPRNFDRDDEPRKPKKSLRDGMPEGSVWFRAAIGRRKNAEARWLLPMICRRGGVKKGDIGAIKIMDTTTEFEISSRVADSFATMIKRPDKEDSIRIEALEGAPQREAAPEKRSYAPRREAPRHETPRHEGPRQEKPRHEARAAEPGPAANDFARDERPFKKQGKPFRKPHDEKPRGEHAPSFDRKPDFKSKKRHQDKPAFSGNSRRDRGDAPKPSFGKKQKKKFRG